MGGRRAVRCCLPALAGPPGRPAEAAQCRRNLRRQRRYRLPAPAISQTRSANAASCVVPCDRIVPLGHRVIAAFAEGMAAADALEAQPAAAGDATAIERPGCELGRAR